ncbi:hypothetical protein M422DRAFT_254091 [Sphaerobolus stellatus SS14]|uniref:Uncharacterized protein n=1 Tax=Sphaerobolus stellatus (strain SS14) TaxID=990650 RepID=A0A0C9UHT5_SPHS4|nr:hypothetical protein M422DRAFT_254091 [Sphaerobolus stellatus SS14]
MGWGILSGNIVWGSAGEGGAVVRKLGVGEDAAHHLRSNATTTINTKRRRRNTAIIPVGLLCQCCSCFFHLVSFVKSGSLSSSSSIDNALHNATDDALHINTTTLTTQTVNTIAPAPSQMKQPPAPHHTQATIHAILYGLLSAQAQQVSTAAQNQGQGQALNAASQAQSQAQQQRQVYAAHYAVYASNHASER